MMDNPWFLRIVALLLALLMFFTVRTAEENASPNSTEREVLMDVPVEVFYDNESAVITGVPPTVDMQIAGPGTMVQKTRQLMDFTLFVDLRGLDYGKHQVMIQTENLSDELQVRIDPAVLEVSIEERVTKEFRIDPEINDQILAEGYFIESTSVDPETVLVTGAESAVESIAVVKAVLNTEADDIDESFTAEARVRVLDADLKQPTVTVEPETVQVTVNVAEYSREVPITIRQTGEAPDGLVVQELTPSQETVTLFGPKSTVDAIEEYVVDVNAGVLSETDSTIEVNLEPPQGVRTIEPVELTIQADIQTEETAAAEQRKPAAAAAELLLGAADESRRVFANVPVHVKGLGPDYRILFTGAEKGRLSLAVTGNKEVLDTLTQADFELYIEAKEETGKQLLTVHFTGPEAASGWQVAPRLIAVEVVKQV
ncbi:CdaR family protein [Indiicoccus explosivorum]|uniref:CdaR family protein n=1 Tax=Indiicoccus explosivorum TaxID=1917864 RepID=UPI001F4DFA64|nr:CdaR family protein [Indiicoccus explosivorum]